MAPGHAFIEVKSELVYLLNSCSGPHDNARYGRSWLLFASHHEIMYAADLLRQGRWIYVPAIKTSKYSVNIASSLTWK